MTIEFDDKGKFFTDIISKIPITVTIQTVARKSMEISMSLKTGVLKDELDLPEKFIAITDAVVYSPDDQVLYKSNFLAIQRAEIIWILPDNEISDPSKGSAK